MDVAVRCVVESGYNMACYHPLQAWYSKDLNPSGKRSLVFDSRDAWEKDSPITISCGQCIGCRLDRSRQWATRCIHEASLYENNCFVTLTFNPDSLNSRSSGGSLDVRDFQLFMKRLRKRFGEGIRFFHCGEYGEKCSNCGENKMNCSSRGCGDWSPTFGRPHYHALIFNFDFPDRALFSINPRTGVRLYTSEIASELWPHGFVTIGDVTFDSAAYVARYIMKKVNGDLAGGHYISDVNWDTGECYSVKPEYITMSRRPGIGKAWFEKFKHDVYPKDFLHVRRGDKLVKVKPPKYYDKLLEVDYPMEFDEVKENRLGSIVEYAHDLTYERLLVKEKVKKKSLERLVRDL